MAPLGPACLSQNEFLKWNPGVTGRLRLAQSPRVAALRLARPWALGGRRERAGGWSLHCAPRPLALRSSHIRFLTQVPPSFRGGSL